MNQTAEDAIVQVQQRGSFGCLAGNPSMEYLLKLREEILAWGQPHRGDYRDNGGG